MVPLGGGGRRAWLLRDEPAPILRLTCPAIMHALDREAKRWLYRAQAA
jgi:hypothetical protein